MDTYKLFPAKDSGKNEGKAAPAEGIYGFEMKRNDGESEQLSQYRGKVLLVVNVASRCGFTPQYSGLEKLYRKYRDRGLVVLGFPCNQFGHQEPGSDAEILSFCETNYQISFPLFSKIEVNGPDEDPLYTFLKKEKGGLVGDKIKWNFTKFLVSRDGKVVARYAPSTTPEEIAGAIEAELGKAAQEK